MTPRVARQPRSSCGLQSIPDMAANGYSVDLPALSTVGANAVVIKHKSEKAKSAIKAKISPRAKAKSIAPQSQTTTELETHHLAQLDSERMSKLRMRPTRF